EDAARTARRRVELNGDARQVASQRTAVRVRERDLEARLELLPETGGLAAAAGENELVRIVRARTRAPGTAGGASHERDREGERGQDDRRTDLHGKRPFRSSDTMRPSSSTI